MANFGRPLSDDRLLFAALPQSEWEKACCSKVPKAKASNLCTASHSTTRTDDDDDDDNDEDEEVLADMYNLISPSVMSSILTVQFQRALKVHTFPEVVKNIIITL